jgi:hypothetical protein
MFERFTDRARRVVVLAQEEARLLKHNYIGTEHILLGLVAEEKGVAAEVLAGLGITLATARAGVVDIIGTGQSPPQGHVPFTPRAKEVLELALREGLALGHDHIGTEHLLLGLLSEGEGVAAELLTRTTSLETVREEVLRLLEEEGALDEGIPGVVERSSPTGVLLPAGMVRGRPWTTSNPGTGPVCPICFARIDDDPAGPIRPSSKILTVPTPDGPPVRVAFLYCGQCGSTLGAVPAPPP